jgi:threonine dehydratase
MLTGPLPSIDDIRDAARQIAGKAVRTPLVESLALNRRVGGRVLVKAEVLQRTGSFKFRGAFNRISRLTSAERPAGVVAFSSGNHAQGVAAAAQLEGVPAVIVMPADAPAMKIAGTKSWGAKVLTYDRLRENREEIGARLARERGSVLVKPYDDFHVIAGQGTVGLEVVADLKVQALSPDAVITPASGGGLNAGIGLAVHDAFPRAAIYTAEPAGFDDHARSFAAGRRLRINDDATTFCDALMAPEPGELTFAVSRPHQTGGLVASDAETARAMAIAFADLKLVLEPAGAVALATVLSGRIDAKDKVVVVIASGGNVDPDTFAQALRQAQSTGAGPT